MKTPYFFLLTACVATSAYAVPSLDDSVYSPNYDPYTSAYSSPATPSSIANSLNKLQKDVSLLKSKVADQSKIMGDLKARQNALEQHLHLGGLRSDFHEVKIYSEPSFGNDLPVEKSRYSRAYAIFRDGGYDQAIAEFQSIISTYPNGEYADNSQYWTGEALLKKGDKQRAMQAFDRVIRVYPRSPKVPDALLKLGMTQYSLGNRAKAKEYYDYLIDTYPGTSSANIAYDKKLQAGL